MSTDHPFRNASSSALVELCCPHCKRNLYIATPESLVTLTTCPHADCQHVALICTGEASGDEGSVALTFERFLEPRVRPMGEIEVADFAFAFGIFVVLPVTMWAHAFEHGPGLLMTMVIGFTVPAALCGLAMIIAVAGDAIIDRRERRRLAAVRRHAFPRARWATGYPNRTL